MEAFTREQLEAMFDRRKATEEEVARMSVSQREQHQAFGRLLLDLRWPVTREGDVMDVSYVAALIAYHMVRCGWRPQEELRVIKSRKPVGRGVATGAVEWVGLDEPDDPLEGIENMTMRQIAALSPQARSEALRRFAPDTPNDLPMPEPSWKVKPNISIMDIPQQPFVESET